MFVNLWGGRRPAADLSGGLRPGACGCDGRTGVDFDPHWFRHTYATRLLRRGAGIEVVSNCSAMPRSPRRSTSTVTCPSRTPAALGGCRLVHRARGEVVTAAERRSDGGAGVCWASSWPRSARSSAPGHLGARARRAGVRHRALPGGGLCPTAAHPGACARATTTTGSHKAALTWTVRRDGVPGGTGAQGTHGLRRDRDCRFGGVRQGSMRPPSRVLGTRRQAGPRGMAGRRRPSRAR